MTSDTVQAATLKIANLIAERQYILVLQMSSRSRLTAADIEKVIDDYGRTFVQLPANFGEYLDAVVIEGRSRPTWSVQVPLWTLEEGRSDLTLELTVTEEIDGPSIELDDLRVL